MTTVYRAQYLVSAGMPKINDAALVVENGRIGAVGRYADLRGGASECKEIDLGEALIVPLLVNAHTHLELTDFADWTEGLEEFDQPAGFIDWLLRLIAVKRKLKPDSYRVSLKNGINQSVAAGTGAVGDILAHHDARGAYAGSDLCGRLFLETLGRDPALILRVKEKLDAVLHEKDSGAVVKGLSPHSPYTISAVYLREIFDRCRHRNLFCSTHVAESPEEVAFVQNSQGPLAERFYPTIGWETYIPRPSGMRPVAYLDQQGGLFPRNLLVHGVQLNDEEIELLGQKKMSLALCPRSNAKLKVGKAPARKLLKAGVALALGTDSLASNDSLSVWDEMAFAHHWFAGELDAPTLFHMATRGGAEALGLDGRCGSLQPGSPAGFQVLRPKSTVAEKDVFDYLVAPGCGHDIAQIYHRGRPQLSGIA